MIFYRSRPVDRGRACIRPSRRRCGNPIPRPTARGIAPIGASIDRSIGETEPETEPETETRRDDDDDDDGAPAVERHCAAASTPALGDGDDDASERDAPYQPVRRIPDECLAREELGEARDATGGGDGGRERGFQSVGSSDEEREAHGYQEDYDLGRGTDRDWTGERRHARPRGGQTERRREERRGDVPMGGF